MEKPSPRRNNSLPFIDLLKSWQGQADRRRQLEAKIEALEQKATEIAARFTESSAPSSSGAEAPEPNNATVTTDKADYAPGETALISARRFRPGATITFSIADDPQDPGEDGDADVYAPFSVTDGGAGDLDGAVNGRITTRWQVPADDDGSGSGTPDALNATLNLRAEDRATGQSATTVFTDSSPITVGSSTVYDESAGLQDNDIALTGIPTGFATLLQGLRTFNTDASKGYVTGAALSGYTGSGSGSNAVSVSTTATVNNLAFTKPDGSSFSIYSGIPADVGTKGVASGLKTIDGDDIYLFRSVSDDNIALGYDTSGQLVLGLFLDQNATTNPTGARIWSVVYEAILHDPSANADDVTSIGNLAVSAFTSTNFDLSTLASGQNQWNVFGDNTNQIIVMADEAWSKGQTVNTSKGGGSTTIANSNQLIEGKNPLKDADGEALVFTFAQNSASLFNASKANYTGITPNALLAANEVSWSISQVQGGGDFAVATIKALNTTLQTGDEFAKDVDPQTVPNDDAIRTITSVTITSEDGSFTLTATKDQDPTTVDKVASLGVV